jgi:halocyanin-like protein
MTDRPISRRTFAGTTATALAAALAGCSGGSGDATTAESDGDDGGGDASGSGDPRSFDGWFDGTSNYSGVVDETGKSEVTVTVGVEANGGNFGFGPAAVRVSPGTRVVWEWNGKGSSHNVVEENGDYESELTVSEGHTFSHTFESAGTSRYYCSPHRTIGMVGAVVVADE